MELYRRQRRLEQLAEAVMGERPQIERHTLILDTRTDQSPFKGLQYFDEADAHLFFGREELNADLANYLSENPVLAVVGTSGSGKSSLVRAGLVPAMRRQGWCIHVVTPTAHPLKALASSLTRDSEKVAFTLRADFYHHCAQYEGLREVLAAHQKYIGPMSQDELRQAIKLPAQRPGLRFEEGLVDLLLRDVGDEPGALPLRSHALLETWRRREGSTLTLAGYTAAGGVHGAIAKTADSVYQRLTPEQQVIARNIFLRLTELGEGTQDTRRRAALGELIPFAVTVYLPVVGL